MFFRSGSNARGQSCQFCRDNESRLKSSLCQLVREASGLIVGVEIKVDKIYILQVAKVATRSD
jgi:hypothetical protein